MRGRLVALAASAGAVALGISLPAEAKTVPYEEGPSRADSRSPAGAAAVALAIVVPARAQPAGYSEVPGSPDANLNPAHVGAVGSQFT